MNDDLLDELTLALPCPFCDAEPGDWCTTRSGRVAQWMHSSRSYEVVQAFGHGYQQGWREGQKAMARRIADGRTAVAS